MLMSDRARARKFLTDRILRLKSLMEDESGAVTVDWVVLTATLAVIGGIVVSLTVDGTTNVGEQVGTVLSNKPVN